jgi:DNA-binding beta-propeller fold protein YncE
MKLAWPFAALMLAATAAGAASDRYRIIERIPGPDGGWDFVRVDPIHDRLWMTRGTSVSAIELATGKLTAGLAPGERLHDVLPVNGGRELLITLGNANTAIFADAKSGAARASVPTGKNPDAAAFDPISGLVLVMDHDGGDVVLIDPKTHKGVGRIEIGGGLEVAAVDGKGRAYVNVEDKNQTVVLDMRARRVERRIDLPGCDGPTGIAYVTKRNWLIASCDGSTDVVDAAAGTLIKTLKTGKEADGVAYDPRRDLAFVAGREGSLSVISLKDGKPAVVQVLKTEANNRTLAVDPRTGRVYLPVAQLAAPGPGQRPAPVAGSFHVLVVGVANAK